MTRDDDLRAHFGRASHHVIKIFDLKPQQHAVSVGPVIAIADWTVVMLRFEPVQLENKLAVGNELLVGRAAMDAPAPEQTLIPSAAGFYVGDRDERLRAQSDTT